MNATMITVGKIEAGEEGYEGLEGQWMVLMIGYGDQFGRYVVKEIAVVKDYGKAMIAARAAKAARPEGLSVYVASEDLVFVNPKEDDKG